jgi:serine/threonine protein kinase
VVGDIKVIAKQLLKTLDIVHSINIVHTDLKVNSIYYIFFIIAWEHFVKEKHIPKETMVSFYINKFNIVVQD